MRQTGWVKWYDYINGYGFTTDLVFIHHKEFKDGAWLELKAGNCIEFDLAFTHENKPKAANIRLIS